MVPFATLACSSWAMDLYWKNPTSGLWNVGGNWTNLWSGTPYVPGPGDTAHIGDSTTPVNAWTVTLGTDVSVDALFSRAALDLAGHSLTLANASVVDGDLGLTNASLLGTGSLTANGTTTLSNTTLGAGGLLTLAGTTTITGTNVLNRDVLATGNTTFTQGSSEYVYGAGAFTNAGSFTVDTGAGNSLHWFSDFANTGAMTFAGGGYTNFATFVNAGTVTVNGGSPLFGGTTFANSGTIIANAGTALTVYGADNDNTGGTIRSDAAYVGLGGNWTTAGLGTLQAVNEGTISLFGKVDNAGSTFGLVSSGITTYRNATITGGSVAQSDTLLGAYTRLTYDGARLDAGIHLNGDSAAVILQNGATLGIDDVRLGDSAEVTFEDAATTFDGTLSNVYGGYGTLRATALTLGANAVATAYAPGTDYSGLRIITSGDLTSFGNLHANPNGQLSAFSTDGAFRNAGLADATNGSLYLSGKSFDNASGTIRLDASTLTFAGDATLTGVGSIVGANGSKIRYASGTLDLGAGTLNLLRFGSDARFGLYGGSLANGSVADSDLLAEDSSGTLSNVKLDRGLRLAGGYVQGTGTIDVTGDLQLLQNEYLQGSTLLSTGDVAFHGGNATIDGSTFGAKTITGLGHATVTNNGAINSNEGSLDLDGLTLDGNSYAYAHAASTIGALVSSGGAFSNNGLTSPGLTLGNVTVGSGGLALSTDGHGRVQVEGDLSVDGTISAPSFTDALDVNGGMVGGTGNIARLYLHGATLAPGHSTGHLNVGDIAFDAASRFDLEIGGDASTGLFDSLSNDYLLGNIALGGTLDLRLVDGYAPTSAQTWRFVEANFASHFTGTFSTLNLLGTGWSYGQDATGAFVSYTPVPEPATLAALGVGLAAFLRRRKAA